MSALMNVDPLTAFVLLSILAVFAIWIWTIPS